MAQKPKVLAKDVNGTMRENKARTIEIEAVDGDIDGGTIVRFLEYAYTGGYSVPDPVNMQSSFESMKVLDAFASKKLAEADPLRNSQSVTTNRHRVGLARAMGCISCTRAKPNPRKSSSRRGIGSLT